MLVSPKFSFIILLLDLNTGIKSWKLVYPKLFSDKSNNSKLSDFPKAKAKCSIPKVLYMKESSESDLIFIFRLLSSD